MNRKLMTSCFVSDDKHFIRFLECVEQHKEARRKKMDVTEVNLSKIESFKYSPQAEESEAEDEVVQHDEEDAQKEEDVEEQEHSKKKQQDEEKKMESESVIRPKEENGVRKPTQDSDENPHTALKMSLERSTDHVHEFVKDLHHIMNDSEIQVAINFTNSACEFLEMAYEVGLRVGKQEMTGSLYQVADDLKKIYNTSKQSMQSSSRPRFGGVRQNWDEPTGKAELAVAPARKSGNEQWAIPQQFRPHLNGFNYISEDE